MSNRVNPNFIWNIADILRGPYKPKEYGSVILPFTVLARFDAVLRDTKQDNNVVFHPLLPLFISHRFQPRNPRKS